MHGKKGCSCSIIHRSSSLYIEGQGIWLLSAQDVTLLEQCNVSGQNWTKLGHEQKVQWLVKAWNWSRFISEKGGNYVTSSCLCDWTKVVVVVAGREGKGKPAWRRSPQAGATHTYFICKHSEQLEWSGMMTIVCLLTPKVKALRSQATQTITIDLSWWLVLQTL